MSDLQYARQQQKRQDEGTRPQHDKKFEGIHALLFTKEDIGTDFGIWDAGIRLSATIVTGSHVLNCWILRLDWTIRVTMTEACENA